MREQIEVAVHASKADYTEIRLEEREATEVSYRGKDLENAGALIETGGIVRCLSRRHGWGVSTFNTLDSLADRVDQAFQCAQVATASDPIELAPVPPVQDEIRVELARDPRGVSLEEKKALAAAYNRIMLEADRRIVDTQTVYSDGFTRVTLANSEGTWVQEDRPTVSIQVIAIARDGEDVQVAREGRAGPCGFEFVQEREDLPQTAARRALDLLEARSVVGGQYPVVIDPQLAGVFMHEAFGHLSESDFIHENPKAREMMVLGRRFGRSLLNVYDDGSVPGLRGTHRYDDEGAPTQRTDLIKEGVLVGRLHSRETAAKMGEQPTGNARALSYRYAPIVRMTNTAIEPGTTSFEEMIQDIHLGVYAVDAYGGNTALESFSFSSGYAYMIREGQLAEMVKDVILAGNLFTTLDNIVAVGDDFKWIFFPGGCGKSGQFPLPVGLGAPHIRIEDVVIGGMAASG
jgi:TldD protein